MRGAGSWKGVPASDLGLLLLRGALERTLRKSPLLVWLCPALAAISLQSLPRCSPTKLVDSAGPLPKAREPFSYSSLGPGSAGEARPARAWNWQLNPELWARSLRQQLQAQLLLVKEEEWVGTSPGETLSDAIESWQSICVLRSKEQPEARQKKQRQFLQAVPETEQPTVLELLLAELKALFSATLQDRSPAAWRYLHAVLGLLPPYRELLVGHLDLLPFLEQLYCWAPWVQCHLQLDLLTAIDQAFPPDYSLLDSASHVDCGPQKKFYHKHPCPVCPLVQARWGGQQVRDKLATWLRPLTLPELQHCLGIVGAEVALEEAHWMDGLGLLPLALATDIPIQYEKVDTNRAVGEPAEGRDKR